jgi:membrane fusion protein (multidrug efflux system)
MGQGMRKLSKFALLAMIVLIALSVGCSSNPPATAAAAMPAVSKPSESAPKPVSSEFIASGPIVVEQQVDLAAQRDGVIAQVVVEAGTLVKKGQLLATLDDRQLTADRDADAAKARSIEADVKNWESEAKVAKADLDRSDAMWKANIISKEQEDHAKYKYDASEFEVEREKENWNYAKNSLASLDIELEKTKITAPFDGVVARRYVRVGQSVSRSDRLFWISAVGPLRVKFTLPESYLRRLKKGTELAVVSPGAAEESYQAKVLLVSPIVDPSSDTIDVTAEVKGPATGLHPGMTVNIRLADTP